MASDGVWTHKASA